MLHILVRNFINNREIMTGSIAENNAFLRKSKATENL